MSELGNYLNMQKNFYESEASRWSFENRDLVVGSYDRHNLWSDYDHFLFKDFDTTNLVALEYGCGPGRNIIRFNNRFKRIDGTDIAQMNLVKAEENMRSSNITNSILKVCDGKSIPFEDNSYDVVFSTICLQHICCYDIRFAIMKDVYRVLKPNGHFCFQMGFGGGRHGSSYHQNDVNVGTTNGGHDVVFDNEDFLKTDLVDKIGFTNYKSDIRPVGPGDNHRNWIFVQVEKNA